MHFHFDQELRLLSLLQSSFVLSRWLLPEYRCQVPPPTLPFHLHHSIFWLPSTMTGCHTNTVTALLSVCHEAPVKTLPMQANFSWSPFLTSLLFLFCLDCHLSLLGPETQSLRACLSLCSSSNRVLSLSIALDIRLFHLIIQPLSSKLLFARLPHGNLSEPSRKHTLRSLRIWCCPVATTLSSALTALCLLSYPSSLLLWLWLACCGLINVPILQQ